MKAKKIEVIPKLLSGLSHFSSLLLGPADQFEMKHRVVNGTFLSRIVAMCIGIGSEFFREEFETGRLVALCVAFGFDPCFGRKLYFKYLLSRS